MGRYKLPNNAECDECGSPFRSSGCIRCPACRTGKQGVRKGGFKKWQVCPRCGKEKGYAAKVCRECYDEGRRRHE